MTNTRRAKYLSLLILLLFAAGGNTCSFYDLPRSDASLTALTADSANGPAGDVLENPEDQTTAEQLTRDMPYLADEPTDETLDREPETPPPPTVASLPIPQGMEGRVRLWEMVFGEYDRSRFVLYHRDHPEIVYGAVIDLPGRKERAIRRLQARLYYLDKISRSSDEPLALIQDRADAAELMELYNKLEALPGKDKYALAARSSNIGALRGRKGELTTAFNRAAPYLPAMERIFAEQGVPPELTRMVFVESMFDRTARSSKGAYGVWQFLPSAAKPYLVMSQTIDERRDPIASSRAAARVLKYNYKRLGSWPLAVTAYNAGVNRMHRAKNRTGSSSLPVILAKYDHNAFGFAVENFYARTLAVIMAEQRLGLKQSVRKSHFNASDYDLVRLKRAVHLRDLADQLGMSTNVLVSLNPAWTYQVEKSWLPIPAGYLLRVPLGTEPIVRAALHLPPAPPKSAANQTKKTVASLQ